MKLDALLDEARVNEAKLNRLHEMELRFLDAATLENLCDTIVQDYRNTFGLAAINLFLFDWDGALRVFLDQAEVAARPGVHVVDAGQAEQLAALSSGEPWLGAFEDRLHHRHFPVNRHGLQSVALLPLTRHTRRIGLLALASKEPARFAPELGTEFLRRLTAVVSVCIENSLNTERLRQLGLRDPLTHLYNRRYFGERMLQAMNVAMRSAVPISCIYLDIDHFKRVNDKYGHPAGDAVLLETARRISHEMRVGEVVARMGGEEFAVMLVGAALEPASVVAERIRVAVCDKPFLLPEGESLQASLSAGVADWRADRAPASVAALEDLLARADRALLAAKQGGRDRVVTDAG